MNKQSHGIDGAPESEPDVRALIDTIRHANVGSMKRLIESLVHLDVPNMLPVMTDLLTDENPDISLAAYEWFARTSNENAQAILIAKLEEPESNESEKSLAAEALGQRGNAAAAIASIRRVARGIIEPTRDSREMRDRVIATKLKDGVARLLVRLAVAEAQLGGDELSSLPIIFARSEMNSDREPIVRVEALGALTSVVGEGMIDTLRGALQGEDHEVVEYSIRALQFLGNREAVDLLVGAAIPARMELAEIALTAAVAVTGPGPGMSRSIFDLKPDELRTWWDAARRSFLPGVCYRLGRPLAMKKLVELLRDARQRAGVANELRIVAGFDCGFNADIPSEEQNSVVASAEHWLAIGGQKFREGALYRYGYERNLGEAVKACVFTSD
jgi:HEAT repeat protein